MPESCSSGLDRIESKSNALSTYERVLNQSKNKWNDPDFPADDSSLQWGQFGYGDIADSFVPKLGMKWLRPSETYYGLEGEVSFFGKLGKPLPQGVQ